MKTESFYPAARRIKSSRFRSAVFCAILAGQSSCALREVPPTWDQIQKDPGTIGVVAARFDPEVVVPTLRISEENVPEDNPVREKAAKGLVGMVVGGGAGAAQGFALGLLSCLPIMIGGPVTYGACLVSGIALGAGIGAGLGGVGMFAAGASPHEPLTVNEAEAVASNFETPGSSLSLQEILRDQVIIAATKTDRKFVSLARQGPAKPDEEPKYADLKTEGVDVVLELAVTSVGVRSEPIASGYTTVLPFATARVRWVRVAGDHVLLARTYEYRGIRRAAIDWSADDRWQYLYENASYSLAQEIVNDLLTPSPDLEDDVLWLPTRRR